MAWFAGSTKGLDWQEEPQAGDSPLNLFPMVF